MFRGNVLIFLTKNILKNSKCQIYGLFFQMSILKKVAFFMYFFYILSFYNHQMSISPFFFFSMVLYHISAQYFNDQNRFPCLISLLEMDIIILCELQNQGGTSLFLK